MRTVQYLSTYAAIEFNVLQKWHTFCKDNIAIVLLCRYMQGQAKPPHMMQHSLQALSPSNKNIVIADHSGVPKTYPCNDPTLTYVRNLLECGGLPDTGFPGLAVPQPPAAPAGMMHNPSLGSLPSAHSQYSSASSISTQGSHPSAYGPPAR